MENEPKQITVSLSQEDYESLKALAYLRREEVSEFIEYLLGIHLQANGSLVPLVKKLMQERNEVST